MCCLIASSSFCNKVSYSIAEFGLSLVYFFNSSSTFFCTIIFIEVLIYSIKSLIGLLINSFDSPISIFCSSDKFSDYIKKYLYYYFTSSNFFGFIIKYKFISSFLASFISFILNNYLFIIF